MLVPDLMCPKIIPIHAWEILFLVLNQSGWVRLSVLTQAFGRDTEHDNFISPSTGCNAVVAASGFKQQKNLERL
jgi:hypothetical protein